MALTGWLKQSTAVTLKIGPFIDKTDGATAETALTISQADVRLSKNGGDFAQKNEATSASHDELGMYDCPINTTDTNTLGILTLVVHESVDALSVRHDYMVLPANVYDAVIGGSDYLQVHAREIDAGLIVAATIASDAITSAKIADGALTAAKFGSDFIADTSIAASVWTEMIAALQAKSHSGTLQAGASGTATLATGASSTDDVYNNCILIVISSTGVAQMAYISDYVGATRVATITPAWITTPDNTYRYVVVAF